MKQQNDDRLSRAASEILKQQRAVAFAHDEIDAFYAPTECHGLVRPLNANRIVKRFGFKGWKQFYSILEKRTSAKFIHNHCLCWHPSEVVNQRRRR